MIFKRIKEFEFDEFYGMLEEAFPFIERKTREDAFNEFLNNTNFMPCFIIKNGKKVGLISYWKFNDFIFVEHLAILKNLRNKTIGTKAFKQFLSETELPIVFEVEKPYDEISKRRINFYKRLGIVFNNFDYFQPSYHGGDDKVPMFFVSYPNPLSCGEFDEFSKNIGNVIYKLDNTN